MSPTRWPSFARQSGNKKGAQLDASLPSETHEARIARNDAHKHIWVSVSQRVDISEQAHILNRYSRELRGKLQILINALTLSSP
jgi:hypothetical protein